MYRVVTDSTSFNSNSEIKKVLEITGVQCLEDRERSKDYPVHNTAAGYFIRRGGAVAVTFQSIAARQRQIFNRDGHL